MKDYATLWVCIDCHMEEATGEPQHGVDTWSAIHPDDERYPIIPGLRAVSRIFLVPMRWLRFYPRWLTSCLHHAHGLGVLMLSPAERRARKRAEICFGLLLGMFLLLLLRSVLVSDTVTLIY